MKRLQDIRIQNKLIGIFVIVFAAGVAMLGWNTLSLNNTKEDIGSVITDSQDQVEKALTTSKSEINDVVSKNREQVSVVLDKTDELLYLQILQIEFRELEAIEKDYVLAGDPADPQGLAGSYDEMYGWLQEDLATALQTATTDQTRQALAGLSEELQAQRDHFNNVMDLMKTDPAAARKTSLEGSARKADNIYNVLAGLVNDSWDTTLATADDTRTQIETSIEQTSAQMQSAIDETTAQLKDSGDRTNSQLTSAIRLSLLTILLFMVAGGVVAAVVFMVSKQIVSPVLEMAVVAESIENEQYQSAESLEPIVNRRDEIGQLARVFHRMAKEVNTRVERLKKQVVELQIVIDQKKAAAQVAEITESEYFTDLQAKVRAMRGRGKTEEIKKPEAPEGTA